MQHEVQIESASATQTLLEARVTARPSGWGNAADIACIVSVIQTVSDCYSPFCAAKPPKYWFAGPGWTSKSRLIGLLHVHHATIKMVRIANIVWPVKRCIIFQDMGRNQKTVAMVAYSEPPQLWPPNELFFGLSGLVGRLDTLDQTLVSWGILMDVIIPEIYDILCGFGW